MMVLKKKTVGIFFKIECKREVNVIPTRQNELFSFSRPYNKTRCGFEFNDTQCVKNWAESDKRSGVLTLGSLCSPGCGYTSRGRPVTSHFILHFLFNFRDCSSVRLQLLNIVRIIKFDKKEKKIEKIFIFFLKFYTRKTL